MIELFATFKERILGTDDVILFTVTYLFGLVGMWFSMKNHVDDRNKASQCTPFEFSMKYFMSANATRLLVNLVALYLAIRFSNEYSRQPISEFAGLGYGLGLDQVLVFLRNRGILINKPQS